MTAANRTVQIPWRWGEPVDVAHPGDQVGPDARAATRSVRTSADPDTLFLWLCQLRRAPYSYDWIDNFGRRSPRQADPAMLDLRVGQTFMTIFTLTSFVTGRTLTLEMKPGWPTRVFGRIVVQYVIEPPAQATAPTATRPGTTSQLGAVLWVPPVGRVLGDARRHLLAWGDLLMMSKQLRVLAALAERDQRAGAPSA